MEQVLGPVHDEVHEVHKIFSAKQLLHVDVYVGRYNRGKIGFFRGFIHVLQLSVCVAEEGSIYVADWGNNRVQIFSDDGSIEGSFGEQGSGEGQFDRPTGIAVDAHGDIYVADWGNNRVTSEASALLNGIRALLQHFADNRGLIEPACRNRI